MKNLILLVLFFMATICSAQVHLDRNQDGKFRRSIEAVEKWEKSEISADTLAMNYIDKFPQAISSPGERILAERSEKTLRLRSLFKKEVEFREYFILYNNQTNNIDCLEGDPVEKEEPSYLVLFSLTSILLMIISNILFKKGHRGASEIATIATAIAITAIAAAIAVIAALVAAIAVIAAFVAAITTKDKNYKVASIMFYIFMAIHIVVLFI